MNTEIREFGMNKEGKPVSAAVLSNDNGMSVTILDYGATIQSIIVPDKTGNPTDVVLGYDTVAEYEQNGGFLGATVGRIANRIGKAHFKLNCKDYYLAENDHGNHLHGGLVGFDKYMWKMDISESADSVSAVFSRVSENGEEGYPGNLAVKVTFALDNNNELSIHYEGVSDADTIFSPTNHSYFNLNGGGTVLGHDLRILADAFAENDKNCLPTGWLVLVDDTPMDFRTSKMIGRDIHNDYDQLLWFGGYDHGYIVTGSFEKDGFTGDIGEFRKIATLHSPESGITMNVASDRPAMQLYTANSLTERKGKNGSIMGRNGAVCLETGWLTDAINHPDWPQDVLKAGEKFDSTTTYTFSF